MNESTLLLLSFKLDAHIASLIQMQLDLLLNDNFYEISKANSLYYKTVLVTVMKVYLRKSKQKDIVVEFQHEASIVLPLIEFPL